LAFADHTPDLRILQGASLRIVGAVPPHAALDPDALHRFDAIFPIHRIDGVISTPGSVSPLPRTPAARRSCPRRRR
jgi:hypothetical protein